MCDRRNGREESAAAAEFRDRARFYAIRQVYGERAYDWYRRVRAAAVPCGFDAGRRAPAVADKFVTGLRPGPVADRLLGERADGRLEDLLAAAVAAEEEQEEEVAKDEEEEQAADDATPLVASRTTRTEDVITEIREGLKLYRYSDGGGGGDDASDRRRRDDDEFRGSTVAALGTRPTPDGHHPRRTERVWTGRNETERFERAANNYPPMTCASCCDLATKLLEGFDDGPPSSRPPDGCGGNVGGDRANDDCHDRSECYCSRC